MEQAAQGIAGLRTLVKWGLIVVVLFCAIWSGWWFLGAQGQKSALQAWLEQQRKQGWQAEASSIDVSGFPMRFRTEINDLALADPTTGWSWDAPLLISENTPDTPTRIAVSWPERQTIAVPGDRAEIRSQKMEALLDLRPGPSMELRQVSGETEALAISGQTGWSAGASSIDVNIAERPEDLGPAHAYDVHLEGTSIKLPKEIVAQIDPTGWLRPSIDSLTVLGHAAFDDPLDRSTVEQGRIALRAATIREAGFEWGDMRLVVKGSIEVDDDGYPVGDVRILAREWRQMVRLAVSSGIISRETARTVTDAIEFVTALTGSGDSLTIPLGLSGGKVRIGPLAIAEAPQLAPSR